MYEINLIHEKIVPLSKQRTRLSLFSLYILIWAITIAVYAYYINTTRNEIETYTAATRLIESRNALPSGVTRDDVVALSKQLDATREALLSMNTQSFHWASKLARLHRYLPGEAWLDEISCRLSTAHYKKPAGGGKPPEPLGEFVVQGTVLLPEGAAGAEALEKYVVQLRGDRMFMASIKEMNHLVLGRERYGNREIARFMIVCVIAEGVRFDA
jgi:hypothetical protein